MKNSLSVAGALAVAALLSACSPDKPHIEAPRPVRTAEVRYDAAREANRYAGTVQSRYEVDQAFRVSGKVAQRKVDVVLKGAAELGGGDRMARQVLKTLQPLCVSLI